MSPIQLPAPEPLLALLLAVLLLPFYYLSRLFRNSTDWRAIRRDADTRETDSEDVEIEETASDSDDGE